MKGDLISCNGTLSGWDESILDMEQLLGCDFTYQRIHSLDHSPLHMQIHVEIAEASYKALYGNFAGLSVEILSTEIGMLLQQNRFPKGSSVVVMYLIPPQVGVELPTRLLCCEKQLLYRGYTLWHSTLRAIIIPYQYPFPQYKTGISLSAHQHTTNYAKRKGAEIAIAENNSGILTCAGEDPLFGIVGREVWTTPIECGVADSVERRLGIVACQEVGLTLVEQPVKREHIPNFDEVFTLTTQGIVSIGSCLGRLFPNSMTKNIAARLESFSV